jgi:hypothetical protein
MNLRWFSRKVKYSAGVPADVHRSGKSYGKEEKSMPRKKQTAMGCQSISKLPDERYLRPMIMKVANEPEALWPLGFS